MKTLRFFAVVAVLAASLLLTRTASADHWRGGWGGWHRGPVVNVGFGYGYWPYPYYAPYYGCGPYCDPYYYDPPVRHVYMGRRVDTGYGDYSAHSVEASVQRALARRGYYHGSIDGDIGPASREAIRDYQSEHHLAATGRINDRLLDSLGL